jgi:hypothetical protein
MDQAAQGRWSESSKIGVHSRACYSYISVKIFNIIGHRAVHSDVLVCAWCVCYVAAVQNERQPRNTATIRPEALLEMDQERALREAAVAVGVFGCVFFVIHNL